MGPMKPDCVGVVLNIRRQASKFDESPGTADISAVFALIAVVVGAGGS